MKVTTMRDDFAVMIVTHGRANDQRTIKALQKAKFSGKILLIIDDLDSQKDEYLEKYGDICRVFDKEKWYKLSDTIDNFHNMKTPLYARNFCFELAKKEGFSYFLMLDDDIESFVYRGNKNDKMVRTQISNINFTIDELISYQKKANIDCIGFANDGGFIGGLNGKFSKLYGRTVQQAMLFYAGTKARFSGTKNEDLHISVQNFDRTIIELYCIAVHSPKRGTNEGGIEYGNMYENTAYSIIICPSAIKVNSKSFGVIKSDKKIFPQIISERWKKNA